MKRTDALILFVLGLLLALLAAARVTAPGYMDADYYYAAGLRLAQGYGMTEPFVWNYLDAPQGLPHPAFVYWMPLPALLAALPTALTGRQDFNTARLPFILLAAFIPPLTAWLGWSLTRKRLAAWLAGGFALLSGFYLPYLLTTESFGLCMLLGTLLILTVFPPADSAWQRFPPVVRYLALGALAGLLHLSRADGLLWLLALLGAVGVDIFTRIRHGDIWRMPALDALSGILFGYALIAGFWYGRNLLEFGSLMPPGGSKTLWLTGYNQTFTTRPDEVSFSNWLASGLGAILKVRLSALFDNLKTWVGVQGSIILWPLALAGLWMLRKDRRVQFAAVLWLVVLAFFSFVFPFAGARGGFFHSGAAFQPLMWSAAALGFDRLMDWGVQKRGWGEARSRRMFIPALLLLLGIFTGIQFFNRVIGPDAAQPRWRASWDDYRLIDAELVRVGAQPLASVMVNNPPGYFAATGRAAVVLPDDSLSAAVSTARHFGVTFLILDANTPPSLLDLYESPASSADLLYVNAVEQAVIYKVLYPT